MRRYLKKQIIDVLESMLQACDYLKKTIGKSNLSSLVELRNDLDKCVECVLENCTKDSERDNMKEIEMNPIG